MDLARHRAFDDPVLLLVTLAGAVPGFAVVYWAHRRAFGKEPPPFVDEPPVWVAVLVLLGGGSAVFFGGAGLLHLLGFRDGRTAELLLGFVFGNACVIPFACYFLWLTRPYRKPDASGPAAGDGRGAREGRKEKAPEKRKDEEAKPRRARLLLGRRGGS